MTMSNDMPPPGALRRRPPTVDRAIMLLWAAVVIGAIGTLAVFTLSGTSLVGVLAGIVGVLIVAFLITKIGVGRNWARIVLLVLFAIGVLQFLVSADVAFTFAPLLFLLGLLQLVLQGGALYLLFTPPGNAWFAPT